MDMEKQVLWVSKGGRRAAQIGADRDQNRWNKNIRLGRFAHGKQNGQQGHDGNVVGQQHGGEKGEHGKTQSHGPLRAAMDQQLCRQAGEHPAGLQAFHHQHKGKQAGDHLPVNGRSPWHMEKGGDNCRQQREGEENILAQKGPGCAQKLSRLIHDGAQGRTLG